MRKAVVRKKPGMTSAREMPLLQDGPPVIYARCIPSKGPQRRRHLLRRPWRLLSRNVPGRPETGDIRMFMFVKEWKKDGEEEARIMKDVPGCLQQHGSCDPTSG
ncbi:hypothetical protein GW17_00019386 [Ensete ventricosum]|nr:hypothetical protein GW17_00019386 [Ensete ventricosum]RZR83189.1 hypothetical protein BHM03_00009738 [Ensete ventricosum]